MPDRDLGVEWTCSRCGDTVTLPTGEQPRDWTRVYFVTPPRGALADRAVTAGDLCNAESCGGLIVAFLNGNEAEEVRRHAQMAEAIARAEAATDG